MLPKSLRLLSLLLLVLSLPVALGGCNTTRGFGQDVKALGENISDEAQENKGY